MESVKSASETTLAWHSRSYFDVKADSKRNKELHQRFPEIQKGELLLDDYICALGRFVSL